MNGVMANRAGRLRGRALIESKRLHTNGNPAEAGFQLGF
ncbi:hypothetical protein [Pseudomonas phage vB_Pae_BR200a]|nr:hypothetical protein [Pseudomonas phage vB_Pae_BR200a]QBI78899.1 hypothetical protein [Pseudomonas phage vB_Pae_BR144a]